MASYFFNCIYHVISYSFLVLRFFDPVPVFWTGSFYAVQAGFKLLGSVRPPMQASGAAAVAYVEKWSFKVKLFSPLVTSGISKLTSRA